MKHLVLVRHGESEWNVVRRIQGQSGTGLTDAGRRQAELTAAYVTAAFPVARIVTSDLQRCEETVAPFEALTGVEAARDVGLRERDFGRWTGMLVTEVAEEHPDVWERWRQGEDVVAELGGESTEQFGPRVVATLERILDAADDGTTTVCITHGGPVWHGTQGLLDLPDRSIGAVANASVTEIIADGSAWGRRLLTWNQVAHLPPGLRSGIVTAQLERDRSHNAPPTGA